MVTRQLELLRFRNTFGAFGFDATCEVAETSPETLRITWRKGGLTATLDADLAAETFTITATGEDGVGRNGLGAPGPSEPRGRFPRFTLNRRNRPRGSGTCAGGIANRLRFRRFRRAGRRRRRTGCCRATSWGR